MGKCSKTRVIESPEELDQIEQDIIRSATKALQAVVGLHKADAVLGAMWAMKSTPVGCDPLDANRPLNLIEQLNQTFTYMASVRAVKIIFDRHAELAPFRMNLGTARGSDIEDLKGQLACEVFAAVSTSNNKKLRRDIERVRNNNPSALHRYVFFMCPGYPKGPQPQLEEGEGVLVWSVGDDLA